VCQHALVASALDESLVVAVEDTPLAAVLIVFHVGADERVRSGRTGVSEPAIETEGNAKRCGPSFAVDDLDLTDNSTTGASGTRSRRSSALSVPCARTSSAPTSRSSGRP